MNLSEITIDWPLLLQNGAIIIVSIIVGLIIYIALRLTVKSLIKHKQTTIFFSIRKYLRGPLRISLPLITLFAGMSFITMADRTRNIIDHLFAILIILSISWLIAKISFVIEEVLLDQFNLEISDNLKARKVHTQIQFFKRIFIVIVAVIALALILISFEAVRQIGTTILASAGIAGVILGFASQKTLSTFLAGLQVAVTQPIRIDDVVIVEGEWGRIEEITLTYVVVRIWDLRRMVLPITYFNEKPFQNWTRVSSDLLGTVYLYVDYTVSVDAVRTALKEILDESIYWDKKVWNVQVTGVTEKTMELRALMSGADASILWNLRCEVREKLVDFLQREYPEALSKVRAELDINQGEKQ